MEKSDPVRDQDLLWWSTNEELFIYTATLFWREVSGQKIS